MLWKIVVRLKDEHEAPVSKNSGLVIFPGHSKRDSKMGYSDLFSIIERPVFSNLETEANLALEGALTAMVSGHPHF
jgi:hypothetical protein